MAVTSNKIYYLHKRPSKKLDHCHLGPFQIIELVLSHAVHLGLPLALKCIHPVFHVSLIQPSIPSTIPNQTEDPLPLLELDNDDEYEVNWILDSRINHHHKGTGLPYLVEWKDFGNSSEATSWEPAVHVQNVAKLVEAFHRAYPDKPKPF